MLEMTRSVNNNDNLFTHRYIHNLVVDIHEWYWSVQAGAAAHRLSACASASLLSSRCSAHDENSSHSRFQEQLCREVQECQKDQCRWIISSGERKRWLGVKLMHQPVMLHEFIRLAFVSVFHERPNQIMLQAAGLVICRSIQSNNNAM